MCFLHHLLSLERYVNVRASVKSETALAFCCSTLGGPSRRVNRFLSGEKRGKKKTTTNYKVHTHTRLSHRAIDEIDSSASTHTQATWKNKHTHSLIFE